MRMPLIITLVAVAMALGAGAMFLMGRPKAAGASPPPQEVVTETVNVPLEERTVNLADRAQSHYLRATIVLEIAGDEETGKEMTERWTPQLMDRTIDILSKEFYAELGTAGGKQALKAKLLAGYKEVMEPHDFDVRNVLFTDFVME